MSDSRRVSATIDKDERLEKLFAEIDGFRDYESSWDPDDPRVDEGTIAKAKTLIESVFLECARREISWRQPSVSVAPDARIHVTWGERGKWARWIVSGCAENLIVLVTSGTGTEPIREEVSSEAAVQEALDFLCGCGMADA